MVSHYLAESVVPFDGSVHIPGTIRTRFNIHPGDTLEWAVDGEALVIRVVRRRLAEKEVHVVKARPKAPSERELDEDLVPREVPVEA